MGNITIADEASIESLGGVLPDGSTVDLIRDGATGRLKLLCFDGVHDRYRTEDHINVDGHTFRPPALDSAVQSAVTWPTKARRCASTKELFTMTEKVFTECGFSPQVAKTATYFAFSALFPEPWSPAPTFIFSGSSAAAVLLLQLLACLARRAMPVTEIGPHGFRSLIRDLHPTVLMDAHHLTPRSLSKLLASCGFPAFAPWKASVAEFSFGKAIYIGPTLGEDVSLDFSVHVHLPPVRRGATMVDEKGRAQIIGELQPQLLDYRLRNLTKVRASDFDLPEMDFEVRTVARLLGRAIVDDPEIQAGVRPLLEAHEDQLRASRETDEMCVIIEALLDMCHDSQCDEIYVGKVAERAVLILKGRGVSCELEPRSVGPKLRQLGFGPKRGSHGRRICVTSDVRRRIHRVARDYAVAAVENGIAACPTYVEIFSTVP